MTGSRGLRLNVWRCALVLAVFAAPAAWPQAYPARPVRLVVPFPAGGVNDIIARIIAQKISESVGQQVVVENRPGAGGNIGTDFVAKAAPDGYTLLSGGVGSLVMNPQVSKVPYDTTRDFAPVILMARAPNVLAVHPSLPAKSVRELIALARSRPGGLNYASGGVGSNPHLSGALFASMTRINIVHVPYKGSGPATTDLLAGQVHFSFLPIPPALPHLKAGKLRVLAVTGKKRSPQLPGVPTVDEAGVRGYEVSPWYGVLAPAGTAREIINRLNAEITRVVAQAEVKKRLAALGAEGAATTPEEYAAIIKADLVAWGRVIREAGIKGE
ncbi:MAG: tripartite tricarboxylate transporter substrate binding protein [Betaproteobacteria bacterium]|nr:tripartite tricarboxylate transporter substrate binding protein [Betaproteobacteria bacterium]